MATNISGIKILTYNVDVAYFLLTLHNEQGNQRWQIPRPPHASAWQRSPH